MKKAKAPKKNFAKPSPRVGNEYQADIPPLIEDRLQLVRVNTDPAVDHSNTFSLGLPDIPLAWENCKERPSAITGDEDQEPRFKPQNSTLLSGVKYEEGVSYIQCTFGKDKMDDNADSNNELDKAKGKAGLFPLPGSSGEAWTDIEEQSFVLGLYMFGKDLLLVKRFVGSKKMGDILCFYYGKFYNSDAYRRWSECLKSGSRCQAYGKQIFSGWTQQKLLARLFSLVSKDVQDILIQSLTDLSDEILPFKDYVFTLKDIVGIPVLVRALGIAQGKQDLIATVREPRKRVSSVASETLFGKPYSSLTPSEIIKILRGNRLSKSQSRVLFTEAVWPRLLAQGWHSEQLKDHKALGLQHSLVFLVCGTEKFSRRLVKGKQYFNSVIDVLNKVASQPEILYPSVQRAAKAARNGCSDCSQDMVKFTVVDTSLLDETEQPKVRELRNLPAQKTSLDTSRVLNTVKTFEAEQIEASKPSENDAENGTCFDSSNRKTSLLNDKDCVMVAENGRESLQIVLLDDNNHESSSTSASPIGVRQSSERMKPQFDLNMNLASCNHEKPFWNKETKPIEDESNSRSNLPNECKDMEVQTCSQNSSDDHSSSAKEDSPSRCSEMIFAENPLDEELASARSPPQKYLFDLNLPYVPSDSEDNLDMTQENDDLHRRRNMIDLNIPYVPPDLGTDHCTDTDMTEDNGNSVMNRPSCPSEEPSRKPQQPKLPDTMASNGRRQCSRSRPMTRRALEGLEVKLLSSKRRKKMSTGFTK